MLLTSAAICAALLAVGCEDSDDLTRIAAPTTTRPAVSTTVRPATTTTASSTTSVSVIGEWFGALEFYLADAVTVGALQFTVDYKRAPIWFLDTGDAVCSGKVGNLYAFHNDAAERTLSAAFVALTGFTGPLMVARCQLSPSSSIPKPDDFVVTVVDASTPDAEPILPLPTIDVVISSD